MRVASLREGFYWALAANIVYPLQELKRAYYLAGRDFVEMND
jgi:hypothetical protein